MREIKYDTDALAELEEWKSVNPKIANKILTLIENCLQTPYDGLGKPEALRHNLTGYWSRRIDKKNRLIYCVTDDSIEIISCKGHYGND